MNKNIIYYHSGCYDGFTAAWVAGEFLEGESEFKPCKYGVPSPDLTEVDGKHVYVLDFSFPREHMIEMNNRAEFMLVLDHHKTAQAACEGLDFCQFDMNRSGAGMAWDHFNGGENRLALVNYVEDRDLWKFKMPFSHEIGAWIASYSMDMHTWDYLSDKLMDDFDSCVSEGRAILRFKKQKVDEIAREARIIKIDGYAVPAVNCTYNFGSEVAHKLLELYPDAPFAAYFLCRSDKEVQFGLRGRTSDDFDVSEIAKKFGGGGHKKAAGYEMDTFHWEEA